jgi:hypothetical protein
VNYKCLIEKCSVFSPMNDEVREQIRILRNDHCDLFRSIKIVRIVKCRWIHCERQEILAYFRSANIFGIVCLEDRERNGH